MRIRSPGGREAAARALAYGSASAAASLPATPIAPPVKRPRGRPRKSAPAPTLAAGETFDYTEPLKDPDADDDDAPPKRGRGRSQSTARMRTRSRSRGGTNSKSASTSGSACGQGAQTPVRGRKPRTGGSTAPPTPTSGSGGAYYLDLDRLEWRQRAERADSASPVRPKPRRRRRVVPAREHAGGEGGGGTGVGAVEGAREEGGEGEGGKEARVEAEKFPTREAACTALTAALQGAPTTKRAPRPTPPTPLKSKRIGAGPFDGLRKSTSGALLFADARMGTWVEPEEPEGEREEDVVVVEGAEVFHGAWTVSVDPKTVVDDGLALKTLHEVVMGLGAFVE